MFIFIHLALLAIIVAYCFAYFNKQKEKWNLYFIPAFIGALLGYILFRIFKLITFSLICEVFLSLLCTYIYLIIVKNLKK